MFNDSTRDPHPEVLWPTPPGINCLEHLDGAAHHLLPITFSFILASRRLGVNFPVSIQVPRKAAKAPRFCSPLEQPSAKLPLHLDGAAHHLFANHILIHLGVLASWREFTLFKP